MGRGWGRKWGRELPVGNAICFIRLFYKPDIQFVLGDSVTDYSVNSQIITITREKGGKGAREGCWGGEVAVASTVMSNGSPGTAPPLVPLRALGKGPALERKDLQEGQRAHRSQPPFSNLQTPCSPQQDGAFK